jgi:hypothetical protein
MDDRAWRTSSHSGGQGNCVEVAGHGNRVLVRDTKDRTGSVLRFSPAAWRRFADQVKRSLGPDLENGLLRDRATQQAVLMLRLSRNAK